MQAIHCHRHTVFEILCGIFASDQYIAMPHTSIGIVIASGQYYWILGAFLGIVRTLGNILQYLGNSFRAWVTRPFMTNGQTTVLSTVPSLFTDFVTACCRCRSTLHRLFCFSTCTGLGGECLAWRTRARVTEDVTAMWTILVTFSTTNFAAAVWSYILMKLGVFHFTCSKLSAIKTKVSL